MKLERTGSIWNRSNRNGINNNWDRLEGIMSSLDKLVIEGNLTPTQYSQLISELHGLIKHGQVSINDIDKNKGLLDQSFLSPELLEQIAGTAPVLSTVADGVVTNTKVAARAISPDKTTFFNTSGNLFDGEFTENTALTRITSNNELSSFRVWENGISAIFPIEVGIEYFIKKFDTSDRFRIATFSGQPKDGDPIKRSVINNDTANQVSFTPSQGETHVVIQVSSVNEKPRLSISKDKFPENHTRGPYIPKELTDFEIEDNSIDVNHLKFFQKSNNLFSGEYILNTALTTLTGQETFARYGVWENSVSTIVQISEMSTHYIKLFEVTDRFRVATFKGEPKIRDVPHRDIINDDNAMQTSFTPESGETHFVVQVSNSRQKPKMMITTGSYANQYERPAHIPAYLVEGVNNDDIFDTNKLFVTGNFSEYIKTKPFLGNSFLDVTGIRDSKAADVYRWYDELVLSHSHKITRSRKGYAAAESGANNTELPIYEYVISAPETTQLTDTGNMDTTLKTAPTLLFVTGIHGDEKGAVYGLYHFIKQALENEDNVDGFDSLISNFNIKIIPVANPSGYNADTRNTIRGVNLNRNFGYLWDSLSSSQKGTAPYSEKETVIIRDWVRENSDAFAYIDYHNFRRGLRNEEMTSYHFTPVNEIDMMYSSFIRKSSKHWRETYLSSHKAKGNVAYGFIHSLYYGDTPSSINDAYYNGGIRLSSTPESALEDPENTSVRFTPTALELSTEIIINYTLSLIDSFGK